MPSFWNNLLPPSLKVAGSYQMLITTYKAAWCHSEGHTLQPHVWLTLNVSLQFKPKHTKLETFINNSVQLKFNDENKQIITSIKKQILIYEHMKTLPASATQCTSNIFTIFYTSITLIA